MIEIKSADAEALISYRKRHAAADAIWEMTERGDLLGYSCVKREEECARIMCLRAPDVPLMDALLRATLNALRAEGVCRAIIEDEQLVNHAISKDYIVSQNEACIKIEEFFSKSVCKG